MARREWAQEFEAAPRARVGNEVFALDESGGADPGVEITDRVPTLEAIDGAPSVDLILTFTLQDPNSGPVVVVGAAESALEGAYHHFNVSAGKAALRVRKLRPRANAAATTLLDGTQLFIVNTDAINAYPDIAIVFEVPSLNWD